MRADLADEVVIPAYDALTAGDRRAARDASPHTFLHALPVESGAGEVTAADLDHCRMAVDRLAADAFAPRPRPFLAVYRLCEGDHVQTGLIAQLDVAGLGETVRGHEATRTDRVEDLVRYLDVVGAQSSPVCLAHPRAPDLTRELGSAVEGPPTVTVTGQDLRQDLWVVDDPPAVARLLRAAGGIRSAVITDGHHRAAAAARAWSGRSAGAGLLVALFPAADLQVAAFDRVVAGPLPHHPADLPARLRRAGMTVRPAEAEARPATRGHARMVAAGRWWDVPLGVSPAADPVTATDVGRLHAEILAPVLGVLDPRVDPRMRYVASTRPPGEIAELAGHDGAGFLVHPPTAGQLLAVAEEGHVLPPKSTFVHPKARSGLLLVPVATPDS